jgi:hypothetical protein
MPYVDKVKSVKNTGVSQSRWAIWHEIWKWSCLPSLLYCISRKTVDPEYTYYSWCMTSTDIVKWRKNEWLWKFWKRNDLYENFEKRGVVEKKGGGGNEIHAPCACGLVPRNQSEWNNLWTTDSNPYIKSANTPNVYLQCVGTCYYRSRVSHSWKSCLLNCLINVV